MMILIIHTVMSRVQMPNFYESIGSTAKIINSGKMVVFD